MVKIKTVSAYTNPVMWACMIPLGIGYAIGTGSYMAYKAVRNIMEEDL